MSFVSQPKFSLPGRNRHGWLAFQPGPPTRSGFAPFSSLALNQRMKPGIAQWLILVQRQADVVDGGNQRGRNQRDQRELFFKTIHADPLIVQ